MQLSENTTRSYRLIKLQAPPTYGCNASHRRPPSPTLTGATPADTGDNHPTVPCTGSETRGTSPLD
ncbi:hypothetical protein TIFTF001_002237 [Ficus carica]|uniref:Uncharacterized protein n=1 Tax=Ficus carica TaxID=3494 RepID=A0AA87ZAL7_FICCA|nr:hypothetical protein TIFTF001_002237 [Ficus carica]